VDALQLFVHLRSNLDVVLGVEQCKLASLATHGTESQVVGLNNRNYLCDLSGTVYRWFFLRKACVSTKVLQRFLQAGGEATIKIDAIVTNFANFWRNFGWETFSLTFRRVGQLQARSLRSTGEHGNLHLPGKISLLALLNLLLG